MMAVENGWKGVGEERAEEGNIKGVGLENAYAGPL